MNGVLVLCLNIGVDPPDIDRPLVCARMECWYEPDLTASQKSLVLIKQRIHDQYKKWHQDGHFKVAADPTVQDLGRLVSSARRSARNERLLFHYNGHGVPMPTATGEIWMFNTAFTKYIPLNLSELQRLVKNPSLYVFDCNAAGLIVNYFRSSFAGDARMYDADSERDCVVLAACGAHETLPVDPKLPADLFTSCLTTPIRTALHCYASRSLITGITPEMIDKIPDSVGERSTPLTDLLRIFTTVSDTIAWNILPREQFKRLFRQDVLLATMMRNFLLASRLMRQYGCTPESIPELPESHNHPLWKSFEYTMEQYLAQVPSNFRMQKLVQAEMEYREQFSSTEGVGSVSDDGGQMYGLHRASLLREESRMSGYLSTYSRYRQPIQPGYGLTTGPLLTYSLTYEPSTFFEDQIEAFEVWLDMGNDSSSPQELPILLALLSQSSYRRKGLQLLSRFLEGGRKAVEEALSIGAFPYILKYFKPPQAPLLAEMVLICGKVLAFDPKCKLDLANISAHNHFVSFLAPIRDHHPPPTGVHLAVALFIVSIFGTHREYAYDCQSFGICDICLTRLEHPDPLVRRWACLCLTQVLHNGDFNKNVDDLARIANTVMDLALKDDIPDVRAAGVCAIAEVLYLALRFQHPANLHLARSHAAQKEHGVASEPYAEFSAPRRRAPGVPMSRSDPLPQNPAFDSRTRPIDDACASPSDRRPDDGASTPVINGAIEELYSNPSTLEEKIIIPVGESIASMGLTNSSVLVRRQVAIALAHAAQLCPEPFMYAAQEESSINGRSHDCVDEVQPLRCYAKMWRTLLELALDPHPVVASYARTSFESILTNLTQDGAVLFSDGSTSTENAPLESPVSSLPNYDPSAMSDAPNIEDIRENRLAHLRETAVASEALSRAKLRSADGTSLNVGAHSSDEADRVDRGGNRAVIHVRGRSGRFNLNSFASAQGPTRIPRVNSASVINLHDSTSGRGTPSVVATSILDDNTTGPPSPKFHLSAGFLRLFRWPRAQARTPNVGRGRPNSNGLYSTSADRFASPPRTQRRSRSYQVLPPQNTVLGNHAISYELDDRDLLMGIHDSHPSDADNGDMNPILPRVIRPAVEKAVDSLFSWSCACMSRVAVDSRGPDHMPEADPTPQYTKLWDSILHQDSEQCLGWRQTQLPGSSLREGVMTDCQRFEIKERNTHYMGAGGGAVVSLAFLPREIGREGDEYIVTGDSTGSVGVYDAQSGDCQSSFGIPGPPGIPDVEVTSVLCLNACTGDSSLRSFTQHSPLILAGAYDGRVAVFRPDLVTKKYSVLSSFQSSGRTWWSNLKNLTLNDHATSTVQGGSNKCSSGGCRSESSRRANGSSMQMKTLLQTSGNGLVLDFHSFTQHLFAAGCEQNLLRVWDLSRESCTWQGSVVAKGAWPTAISSPPWAGFHTVVVGASDGSVSLVDTRQAAGEHGEGQRIFGRHDDPIVSTAFGLWVGRGRGETIVSADCEGCIKLWDPRQTEGYAKRSEVKAHDSNLAAMAAHSSGNFIASGSTANCVKVFGAKLASPKMICYRDGTRERISPVTGLAFQQDLFSLAIGCADSTVTTFDLESATYG